MEVIRWFFVIFDLIKDIYYFAYVRLHVYLYQRKSGHFKYTQIKPL